MDSLSLNNSAVQAYIVYSAILALKLLSLSSLTAVTRTFRGVWANPEDAKALGGTVKLDDPKVERIRRAQMNGLENIPAFWVLAALYLTTGPSTFLAAMLFRAFTISRIVHSIFHAIIPIQPARSGGFAVSFLVNAYMALNVLFYYIGSL